MALLQIIVVVTCVLAITNAAPLENGMPSEIVNCIQKLTPVVNTTDPKKVPGLGTPEDVYLYCLQQFVWRADMVHWEEYNITKKDKDFVNGLLYSMMKPEGETLLRNKRKALNNPKPPTSSRIRKEYRVLKNSERKAFHLVLQQMKDNGTYDTFANLHRGVASSAHNGPNFLGWHRIYLVLFEEAMRKFDKSVSLPYWDSRLDDGMVNPANTILFSSAFLGNGNGYVTTGPFANWDTIPSLGKLRRNIGGTSSLFTRDDIREVLKRCRTRDITYPTALPKYDFEYFHGGPHGWVGGQMGGLTTSSYDPVFFLHHAFVDCIWERFRVRQATGCKPKVNPETDYPSVSGPHGKNEKMVGLPPYKNIDGYCNYWTKNWYKCDPAPSCPSCGNSPYLTCDDDVCVSNERSCEEECQNIAQNVAQTEEALGIDQSLDVGERFRAPPAEPRTQEAQLARMKAASPEKRAIP